MPYVIIFIFGVLATILTQKIIGAIGGGGNSQISIGTDSIQIKTVGRKVIIKGKVESVTVNDQALLTHTPSSKK